MATASELPIDTSASAMDMAEAMFGSGITITSASYTGDSDASGIYSNGDTVAPDLTPSDTGVILSTGEAEDVTRSYGDPNVSHSTSTNNHDPGDSDLTDIAGLDQPHVRSAYDVLTGRAVLGPGPVFIYGAGEVGSETAKYASARGRQVTLATRSTDDRAIMRQALRIFRDQLVATITDDPAITIRTGCTLTGIGPDHVQVMAADGPADIPAATVLLAAGRVPETGLADAVSATGLPHIVIGDARDVRRIGDAVNDAYVAVRDWTRQQDASAPSLGELPC